MRAPLLLPLRAYTSPVVIAYDWYNVLVYQRSTARSPLEQSPYHRHSQLNQAVGGGKFGDLPMYACTSMYKALRSAGDGAGLTRGAVLGGHTRTRSERRKRKNAQRVPKEREKTKTRRKGPASNERGRFRSGSSERPGMCQPSTLSEIQVSGSIHTRY